MTVETPTAARSCDGCTACCYGFGVAELEKPPVTPCTHCDEGVGCKIYATKPQTCSSFACWWLGGNGTDTDAPALTGLACAFSYRTFTDQDPPVLNAFEAFPGALLAQPAQDFIERMLRQGIAVRTYRTQGVPQIQFHMRRDAGFDAFALAVMAEYYTVVWLDVVG